MHVWDPTPPGGPVCGPLSLPSGPAGGGCGAFRPGGSKTGFVNKGCGILRFIYSWRASLVSRWVWTQPLTNIIGKANGRMAKAMPAASTFRGLTSISRHRPLVHRPPCGHPSHCIPRPTTSARHASRTMVALIPSVSSDTRRHNGLPRRNEPRRRRVSRLYTRLVYPRLDTLKNVTLLPPSPPPTFPLVCLLIYPRCRCPPTPTHHPPPHYIIIEKKARTRKGMRGWRHGLLDAECGYAEQEPGDPDPGVVQVPRFHLGRRVFIDLYMRVGYDGLLTRAGDV